MSENAQIGFYLVITVGVLIATIKPGTPQRWLRIVGAAAALWLFTGLVMAWAGPLGPTAAFVVFIGVWGWAYGQRRRRLKAERGAKGT